MVRVRGWDSKAEIAHRGRAGTMHRIWLIEGNLLGHPTLGQPTYQQSP